MVKHGKLPMLSLAEKAGEREAGQREAGQREAGQREAGQREAGQREAGQRETGQHSLCKRLHIHGEAVSQDIRIVTDHHGFLDEYS